MPGTRPKFDVTSLTLGEISLIEDLTGIGIGAFDETKPQGKFLAACYMIARRRDGEPTYNINRALSVGITEAQEYLGFTDDDDDDADASAVGEPTSGQPSEPTATD